MFRRLTAKELKRVQAFLDSYEENALGISPNIFYGSSAELVGFKLVMAGVFMLLSELKVVDKEEISLSAISTDSEQLLERVAIGMFEDMSYSNSFIPAFEAVGWNVVDAEGIVPHLVDLADEQDGYYSGADVFYYCLQNKSWEEFFKLVRENGLMEDRLYKKVGENLPCDFLSYYFSGDIDYIQPTHGYMCHMMGYDGADCDLNMLALNITFPLKCLVCEYYMYKMMDKYPVLKGAL